MSPNVSATKSVFMVDLFDVYGFIEETIYSELGTKPFKSTCDSIVNDLLEQLFLDDQAQAERLVENRLIKMFIEPLKAIYISRKLFDMVFGKMFKPADKGTLRTYVHRFDKHRLLLLVSHEKIPSRSSFYEDMFDGFVPERMRRSSTR